MFLATYRQRRLSPDDKARLAGTLEAFLTRNPKLASRYRAVILGLLRNNSLVLSLRGLSMTGTFLSHLGRADLTRLLNKLASKNTALRHTALQALRRLMERADEVEPTVISFCASRPVMRRLQRVVNGDSDPVNRAQAAHLLRNVLTAPTGGSPSRSSRS